MIEKVILTKDSPETLLKCETGFNTLNIISACSNNQFSGGSTNGITLRLKSKDQLFTMYSYNIPGTLAFNCYDLLNCSKQLPALETELFNQLAINGMEILEKENLIITLEIEYD